MSVEAILMNEDKIMDCIDESDGICLSCGAISYEIVEPDAVNYLCTECGEKAVTGMETALIGGLVVSSKSRHPTLDKYIKKDK